MEGLGALGAYLPLIVLFGVMYLLLIRPQQTQQRKRREMLSTLKKGDKIVTLGGVFGTITEIKDERLQVRIADKVEIWLAKNGVSSVVSE